MVIEQYSELIKQLTEHRHGLSASKRKDYTKGSDDVLANFKNVAESTGLRPEQVLLVYMQKQFDAVANYVKSNGQSESEPIKERISDLLNYGELLWGLLSDEHTSSVTFRDEIMYFDSRIGPPEVIENGINYRWNGDKKEWIPLHPFWEEDIEEKQHDLFSKVYGDGSGTNEIKIAEDHIKGQGTFDLKTGNLTWNEYSGK